MNYLLSWFVNWSDLQKEDFVPVLAEKMSNKWASVNGVCDELQSLGVEGRPVSLFQCQVSLFKGWVNTWSDDLKSYLLLRLKILIRPSLANTSTFLSLAKTVQ